MFLFGLFECFFRSVKNAQTNLFECFFGPSKMLKQICLSVFVMVGGGDGRSPRFAANQLQKSGETKVASIPADLVSVRFRVCLDVLVYKKHSNEFV